MLGAVSLRTADNGDLFEYLEPALTEVGVPSYEFGSEAALDAALSSPTARRTAEPRAGRERPSG